jgi:hypothetical protein
MFEWVLSDVRDNSEIKGITSILNFYNNLKAVGLRLELASPGGFHLDEHGGFVHLSLPGDLTVSLMVDRGDAARVELGLMPSDGVQNLVIDDDEDCWRMYYFGGREPSPVIAQLARQFGVELDGEPVPLDATQLAHFCRELTLLTGAAPSTLPPTCN